MTDHSPAATARESLAEDLRAHVRGDVQFGAGDRALYATDSSNYRQVPIGVVRPLDADDLAEVVRVCRDHEAPLTMRGAGTSLAGQATNNAVIVDVSRHMTAIVELDPDRRLARVQPGVVLDTLRDAAERHGLTFGPDPATHDRCTIGGMLGNDSCGAHSIMAGRTSDNVESLEVLTYGGLRLTVGKTTDKELEAYCAEKGPRGDVYRSLRSLRDRHAKRIRERFPKMPRLVSGFPLHSLLPENGFDVARALVGTEGTCVTILEATLRLVPSPAGRALVMLGFEDVFEAADRSPEIMTAGPIGLEGFDDRLVEACRRKRLNLAAIDLLPKGGGWLLVEFGGQTNKEAEAKAREVAEKFGRGHARVVVDRAQQQAMWTLRESAVGATAVVPGKPSTYPGWEDSAVPPDRLGAYLRELDALIGKFGYERTFYGHFGDGCLHLRCEFDFKTPKGRQAFRSFLEQAAELVVRHGGSLSGEHGDGQARGDLLPRMFGLELVGAFAEFKSIWDPADRMNPGKVVSPRPLDADLRPALTLKDPNTISAFADDGGSMATALARCVGVGKCRRDSGGAMCPTFQATHEERHSTRGRARLLWEMLEGEVLTDLWRNEDVLAALDMCIACKSCKNDCPVQVDIAAYKAEFMAHHYAHRPRPRVAYSMGLIHWWAHLAQINPKLANTVATMPGLAGLAKAVAGVDGRRKLPRFAEATFRTGISDDEVPDLGGARDAERRVVLFADTFTEGFVPSQGAAALRVLRAAGYTVEVPRANLCCGRPLYDRGFLRQGRRLLKQIVNAFEPELDSGVPVIVLEPSCEATFHDELLSLLPSDPRARRLHELVSGLGAFVAARPEQFGPVLTRRVASAGGAAVMHGHCHQKALVGLAADEAVLRSVGVATTQPEPGCCGMAGAFGFERGEHYELSMKIGERALLPAVRSAPEDGLVIASGFSCREQISQGTGRRALHLAEVLELALGE